MYNAKSKWRIEMKHALTHIKRFSGIFNYIYNISKHNEDHIRKFVETEYPPKDREWAYICFKNKI